MISLDNLLSFVGIVAEAAVLALLLYRRVYKTLPVFCVYCVWDLSSNIASYSVLRYFPNAYASVYFADIIVDSALEFAILVELTWSVLRPLRASLPRSALVVVGVLILAAGAAIWPFSGLQGLASFAPQIRNLVRVQQTVSILRIIFFMALAGCSQLLSIGWRNRELQVATGLGFYSLTSLAVTMLHTHQAMGPLYGHLKQIVISGYLCSLLYWVFSFAQKEAERREFSPQMQSLLLAVAGSARTTRVALSNSTPHEKRNPRNR